MSKEKKPARKSNRKEKPLTKARVMDDFKYCYRAKQKLLERQNEDFLYAMGDQWNESDLQRLRAAKVTPVTDNRIAPNLFLLCGLERQNRSDFKAFPTGEEDGVKSEIASALFRDVIRKSGYGHKSSEQFKDGATCGESHLELYLDYSGNLLTGKPQWKKCDGNMLFQDPASREYDFDDARFVYKVTYGISKEDLISMYPEKEALIEQAETGKLDLESILGAEGAHVQKRDYPSGGEGGPDSADDDENAPEFDLLERYYKKWVPRVFVGDKKTGEIVEAKSKEDALAFIEEYHDLIRRDQIAYESAVTERVLQAGQQDPRLAGISVDPQMQAAVRAQLAQSGNLPPPPPPQDPERYVLIEKRVPEIWCCAVAPGVDEPLADERAWFYPKWKRYPFVPYFARFSTAPIKDRDKRHLLVQGLVHGVKGAQEKHNKAETLMLRHLNGSTNSGWLSEQDSWVDPAKVEQFGTQPGVNLEYKQGRQKPERITPAVLSQAHAQIALDSAEAIKAQLGMNSDLIAAQQGGGDSGRAIALRQKQGLLMVQELFDNKSRSNEIAGRMLLSQLGEIYDTETAKKVMGEALLAKLFPPPTLLNEQTGEPEPMKDPQTGKPMIYDEQRAEVLIAEVLGGELGEYDVTVGEAVASETQRMATSAEIQEMVKTFPGLIPPPLIVKYSQLPESAKAEIAKAIEQAMAQQQQILERKASAGSAGGGKTGKPEKGGQTNG